MAAVQRTYGLFWRNILNGTYAVNWPADTIKCALLSAAYAPNVDTDQYWGDIVANELAAAGGYSAGGVVLAGVAAAYNAGAHEARFTANAAVWTGATFTWRYAAVYKSTGVNGTSPLIAYFDPGGPEQVTAGTATVTWDATGVFKVAV